MIAAQKILDIKNLSIHYESTNNDVEALSNISLEIFKGEILALSGASGSGKSTLGLAILNLIPPTFVKGNITLYDTEEHDLHSSDKIRNIRGNRISMIFQEPSASFNPVLKCGNQIAETAEIHQKLSKESASELALSVMELCGLQNLKKIYDSYPFQLSGGQLQRLAIAMAIINDPLLLIADEPCTSLDSITQNEIHSLLTFLCKTKGLSLLYISHDIGSIEKIASRVLVLEKGKMLLENEAKAYLFQVKSSKAGLLQNNREEITNESLMLKVEDVSIEYKTNDNFFNNRKKTNTAVEKVNFELHKGEILGIIGESGGGKSSIANAIVSMIEIESGRIEINGININTINRKDFSSNVQIIFQDPGSSLDHRIIIGKSIGEPIRNLNKKEIKTRVLELLEAVNLPESYYYKYPYQLSGGEKQRVCIARALSLSPEIMICDEAVSNLDEKFKYDILKILNKLNTEKGMAIIFISHDLRTITDFCHRILILKEGKIVESGNPKILYKQSQDDYTKKLFESI